VKSVKLPPGFELRVFAAEPDVQNPIAITTDERGRLWVAENYNWPADYRARVYTPNLHGRRINSDILERENAGYTAKHGPDMCFIAGTWFRGMDLITGPDGGVFIADWSDTGECHDHDGVHRTSGRIYKLTYGQPKPVQPFDLSQSTMKQLAPYQLHENDWWARQSRRILQERATLNNAADDGLAGAQHALEALLLTQAETPIRIRLVVAMNAIHAASEPWLVDKVFAAEEHEKVLALRLLSDRWSVNGESPSEAMLQKLQTMEQSESSGLVCLYLASTLQRLPVDARWSIVDALDDGGRSRDQRCHDATVRTNDHPADAPGADHCRPK